MPNPKKEKPTNRGRVKIDNDPVVDRVLGADHEPIRGVICVGGFVGRSPRADHIRLFTAMNFSECIDIPEDSIVGQEKIQKPGIPDGTYVWFYRDANISLTVVDPNSEVSTFLEGPLLQQSPAASKMAMAGAGGMGILSTPICSIIVISAVTSVLLCTRIHRLCPDPTTEHCPEPPEPVTFTDIF
jgi:hypothetical protein